MDMVHSFVEDRLESSLLGYETLAMVIFPYYIELILVGYNKGK